MNTQQIDFLSAGMILAYDAKTGEVLWTHEELFEVDRCRGERPVRITDAGRERIRAEAAQVFRDREVHAIIAPEGFALGDNTKVIVDPQTKAVRREPVETRSLGERLAISDSG